METDKILRLFLAIFLFASAIPANAQKEEWNELFKNNLQKEKDIQSLIADTTALHQTIEKFDAEQLRLKVQIDSIASLSVGLKGDVDNKNISAAQQKVDSLNAVVKKLQERKKELASINSQRETILADLKSNISGMGAYSAIKDEQMYSYYQEMLSKPFSAITIEKLNEIDFKLSSFSELPDFNEFNVRFIACKRNKEVYDAAVDLLTKKYDADQIIKTRDNLNEILDIKKNDFRKGVVKLSEAQFSEVDTLDIRLSRYSNGITLLQSIVKAVNDSGVREQNQGNKMACIDAMRSIVFSDVKEEIEKRQRYFDMIPSLHALYQKYWNELQADPFMSPSETETIIMQLKNE